MYGSLLSSLSLSSREALLRAYNVLADRDGIRFHDFLLFMQQYKPRIREHTTSFWPCPFGEEDPGDKAEGCTHTNMHTHTHTHMHTHTHAHTYMHTHTYTDTCTHSPPKMLMY